MEGLKLRASNFSELRLEGMGRWPGGSREQPGGDSLGLEWAWETRPEKDWGPNLDLREACETGRSKTELKATSSAVVVISILNSIHPRALLSSQKWKRKSWEESEAWKRWKRWRRTKLRGRTGPLSLQEQPGRFIQAKANNSFIDHFFISQSLFL